MNLAPRILLITTLLLSAVEFASAQETTTQPPAATSTTATSTTSELQEPEESRLSQRAIESRVRLREEFSILVRQHPPQLGTVISHEPGLLSNEQFLAAYPEVKSFLEKHPQIRQNPHYYLSDFRAERALAPRSSDDEVFEMFAIIGSFAVVAFALLWIVRTIIEQKRWNRLSRSQSEVHNKILDRFGTSAELLDYIKTPAGSKFLESAPIPLHEAKPAQSNPLSRIMWSIQAGVVIASGGFGMLVVSFGLDPGPDRSLFAMGAIALCVGLGFVASAFVSLYMTRRLGPFQDNGERPLNESGLVR